ncbi:ComEC/Rec2 family competence protein [Cognatishimia activa]|uniref:ComEC/Rec2 family competence protein n=1 Tax=Cognatishimia activa TaxID=1715691 RepID=A0A975I910_9RHOB|nr:ComEC/Rec2 family competence protein [Cognatishimia activa]
MALFLERTLRGQSGHLFHWCPVFLALGIGLYFSIRFEPDQALVLGLLALAIPLLIWAALDRSGFMAIPIALTLVIAGFALATWRAHEVAAPRLDLPYNGLVAGRVIEIDRSSSDALRVTLDQVAMWDLGARAPPERVRLSLHGKAKGFRPLPLQRIEMRARLAPPSGPVEPGGFDFQRHAWFQSLGALGYTRAPPREIALPPDGVSVASVRFALSEGIRKHLSGDVGAVAAAITTGDRSHLRQGTTEHLRTTNLAHLLAISGLHMGLLVGVVFAGLRSAMALWPYVALHVQVKKYAAGGALLAAVAYLALSGASIATERAFVMVAVALVAVMLDRRAISMRSVAIAALIVLVLRPESLLSPGFHMSFTATTALVWVFGLLRSQAGWPVPGWLKPVLALCITSFVAGAATTPFAGAHFNGYAAHGLPANLLAVPIMGAVVMPAAVVAFCLAPLGLEGLALTVMGWGLQWILWVAAFFANLDGARRAVVAPPSAVLPVISLGALFVMLWAGRLRVIGILPLAVGGWLWIMVERPDVLIDESSALVGVMTEFGRAVSKPRGQGFAARVWLENDGDGADQLEAFERRKDGQKDAAFAYLDGHAIWVKSGKVKLDHKFTCRSTDILVASKEVAIDVPCRIITPKTMAKTGALAIYVRGDSLEFGSVVETRGKRLWSPPAHAQ